MKAAGGRRYAMHIGTLQKKIDHSFLPRVKVSSCKYRGSPQD